MCMNTDDQLGRNHECMGWKRLEGKISDEGLVKLCGRLKFLNENLEYLVSPSFAEFKLHF